MKQRIEQLLHNLGCVVCNPFVTRRRGRETDKVRDNAHVIWADKLAQEARRERLRKAIDSLEDVQPWEADLLMNLGERDPGQLIVTNMPRQHGPGMSPAVIAAGLRLLDELEGNDK